MEAPDPEDPTAPEYALYELLGQLQYLMIEVLRRSARAPGPLRRALTGRAAGAPKGALIPLLISKSPDRVWSPHRLAA